MKVIFLVLALSVSGCSSLLTPELIKELAQDSASFCAEIDVRGGAGGIVGGATGGYGQSTVKFCRSNTPEAKVSIDSGGIFIEHGEHLSR